MLRHDGAGTAEQRQQQPPHLREEMAVSTGGGKPGCLETGMKWKEKGTKVNIVVKKWNDLESRIRKMVVLEVQ